MKDELVLQPGTPIDSQTGRAYRVVQTLGAGGNAVTYLVIATSGAHKGVLFALKIFRRLSMPHRRTKFIEEIAFLQKCDHPSIMRVFDDGLFHHTAGGKEKEYPFVVAEYLPQTLYHIIRSRSATLVEKVSYALQLASALAFLESLDTKVVHRDIKPQNIFVKGRSCVLGDFGLMKQLDGIEEEDREVFKQSVGAGMPFFYRTPDLIRYVRGEADLSVKTDVFQLGLVIAELFTGRNPCRRPPDGDHLADLEMDDLCFIPGCMGGAVSSLIESMLVRDPAQREGAAQMVDAWFDVFTKASDRVRKIEGHAL